MKAQEKPTIYRILFSQEGKIYEIYTRFISEDSLIGFIEVEELIFTDPNNLVIDPSEERLKNEFHEVKRSYIPLHLILRIDEMEREGVAKIKGSCGQDNIHHFPKHFKRSSKEKQGKE